MIHVFELAPVPQKKQDILPKFDIVRFLPKCEPGDRFTDCNWNKEYLKVCWLVEEKTEDDPVMWNVKIWERILSAANARVNDDMDNPEEIEVYMTISSKNSGTVAAIVESRNIMLEQMVKDKVTQETLDRACKYCKLYVPIYGKIPLKEDDRDRINYGKTFRWKFVRWVVL